MRLKFLPAIACLPALLAGCNGIFDGIYDEPVSDREFEQGLHAEPAGRRYTLMLDARSYSDWHFISLRDGSITTVPIPGELTGEWDGRSGFTYHFVEGDKHTFLSSVPADPQPEPEEWDFAIHHFDVRTNGGAAAETPYTDLSQLPAGLDGLDFQPDVWSTTHVIYDLVDMMAYRIGFQNSMVNPVLTGWVKMDISSPPPTFAATGKVYIMRLADGTRAALHLDSYMSPKGTKGFLTIGIIYPYE